jgi:predicted enzyme related to lactoylglutathione lyase
MIMSKSNEGPKPGHFCWNELVTSNVPAAKIFYSGLLGWKTKAFGNGVDYTITLKGKDKPEGIGGMMKCPKPGQPAQWIPYILVDDVDATVKKAARLRGKVCMRRLMCRPWDASPFCPTRTARHLESSFGIIKPAM